MSPSPKKIRGGCRTNLKSTTRWKPSSKWAAPSRAPTSSPWSRTNDLPGTPRHVLAPGKFNEDAFRTLDEVLAAANRTGVRLIIPLVDNWPWMGGRAEYAGFRGKTKDDFWTDPQLIADFEQTIHFILTRTNTVTGVRYADDKSILCWETGNEIASPAVVDARNRALHQKRSIRIIS